MFKEYKEAVKNLNVANISAGYWPDNLRIAKEGNLSTWYAPFDHLNEQARVILMGITPGQQQAKDALIAAHRALRAGLNDSEALKSAKVYASFSGPMRKNLVSMLDHIGLNRCLGIKSCDSLWNADEHLVHFTSALRYPVFKDMNNYSGSPALEGTEFLRKQVLRWASEECRRLGEAWVIPLGEAALKAAELMVQLGVIEERRVLRGMPHPSRANMERIMYFLGQKNREALSKKVNPFKIDKAKQSLLAKIDFERVA